MDVVDQVERVYPKNLIQEKIFFALHKRGWGQLGRTAVCLFGEGMNLFIE